MASVRTTIYGRDVTLACDDGQEARLNQLVAELNQRAETLAGQVGRLPEHTMLVYAGLMLADEMLEAKLAAENAAERAATPAPSVTSDDTKLILLQEKLAENLTNLAGRIEKIAVNLEAA